MKHTTWWLSLPALVLAGPSWAQSPTPINPADPATQSEGSYLLGSGFGEQLNFYGVTNEVNFEELLRGIKEGVGGKKSTPAERGRVQEFVRAITLAAVARNRSAAKEFLARNGAEKGVKTTASGLQYKVLVVGDKKAPTVTEADEVTVNYRGKLLDGSEFDSSYAHGTQAKVTMAGVIQGWREALPLMRPGARWQLFVPPELGYSDTPRPGIPPGSLLIFEIDLIAVRSMAAPAAPPPPAQHPPAPAPGAPPKNP